jgi:hypothetical protein
MSLMGKKNTTRRHRWTASKRQRRVCGLTLLACCLRPCDWWLSRCRCSKLETETRRTAQLSALGSRGRVSKRSWSRRGRLGRIHMSKGSSAQSVESDLDHVIIFNERHLLRVLSCYFRYYHTSRTHLSLNKDGPDPHGIHPPSAGKIVAFPEVGGLHHRYERRAA